FKFVHINLLKKEGLQNLVWNDKYKLAIILTAICRLTHFTGNVIEHLKNNGLARSGSCVH
ncbi:hypothetical protein, partial [Avibacterium gallinarum]|uniref:hypothetical protein n=1 Tax=Avibacterium gallinarum TaxID=755 RepID=UPI003BF7F8CE